MSLFENVRADLRAHAGNWGAQGFWALAVYRFGRWSDGQKRGFVRTPMKSLYTVLFGMVRSATGIDLPFEVEIGRNFVIDHFGGIVVSRYAKLGDDCRIRNGVCIGIGEDSNSMAPVIGSGVDIGAGAQLIGRITIGDNVVIGANAVVTIDVPSNSIAVGIPAVVKARRPNVGAMPWTATAWPEASGNGKEVSPSRRGPEGGGCDLT